MAIEVISEHNIKRLGRKGAVAVFLVEVATGCWLLLLTVDTARAGETFSALLAFLGSVLAFFGAANVGVHMAKKGQKEPQDPA